MMDSARAGPVPRAAHYDDEHYAKCNQPLSLERTEQLTALFQWAAIGGDHRTAHISMGALREIFARMGHNLQQLHVKVCMMMTMDDGAADDVGADSYHHNKRSHSLRQLN